jgi:hypothetical protein
MAFIGEISSETQAASCLTIFRLTRQPARSTDRAFRHSRGLLLRLDSTAAVRDSFACKGMSPAGQPEAGLCVSFCVSLGRMGMSEVTRITTMC